MPGYVITQAAGPGQDGGLHGRALTPLARRIAAGRADTSLGRDPDYIRRVNPGRMTVSAKLGVPDRVALAAVAHHSIK